MGNSHPHQPPAHIFRPSLPDYHIIGEADGYIYYISLPTDVQGDTENAEIWSEWQELYGDMDWVLDHATLLNEDDGKMAVSTAVNIRSTTSTSGAIMGVVPKGEIVTTTGGVKMVGCQLLIIKLKVTLSKIIWLKSVVLKMKTHQEI